MTSMRQIRVAVSGVALALAMVSASAAKTLPRGPGNVDARVNDIRDLKVALTAAQTPPSKPVPGPADITRQVKTMRDALASLQQAAPGATAHFSTFTAAPEVVSGDRGALSTPAQGKPGIDVVRAFLHANAALYGLTAAEIDGLAFLGESLSPKSGLRMVRVEQRIQGIPVFQSETRFILDRDGRVWRSLGLLVPDGAVAAAATPALSASQAFLKAMGPVGIALDPTRVSVQTDPSGKVRVRVNDKRISGDVGSDLVYFPAAPGLRHGHLHRDPHQQRQRHAGGQPRA